ncbi:tRNA methyltransferase PPM2 [Aspergillus undulatus]|uniref:tRNA methyltransferase PPM2 n=1 Tax=Aspergillus undulatus TaxID=1810928 RepID=UPI003CCD818E
MTPANKPAKAAVSSKEEKSADLVMGTNNSSIVSKRSVENLYYPEPHFFRYFVKKPQRRAPLINREYWLRMHAMKESVRRFMREPSDKPKFVLSLGCGFDPLPFILLKEDRPLCSQTTFVDVDYEKLMINKKTAVQKADIIKEQLGLVEFGSDESAVQIRSEQYIAIGCDLENLEKLDHVLKAEVLSAECTILFLAEVALTYMGVKSANAVIDWASKLNNDAQFCILEQFAPEGPEHPFTSAMTKNYGKLGTHLYAIHEYPSLADQERRFTKAGWTHAHARSLWDLWSDDEFVGRSLRISLDLVEPFDEWEEFALFESHYFLLHASKRPRTETSSSIYATASAGALKDVSDQFKIIPNCISFTGQRRYGAVVTGGEKVVGLHAGIGPKTRLADTDRYTTSKGSIASISNIPSPPPSEVSARQCHTITDFNDSGDCLLVGGRTSPAAALQDTWIRKNNEWQKMPDLPTGRYRHSATRVKLGSDDGVLIYGGKASDRTTLDAWMLWCDNGAEEGWKTVTIQTTTANTPAARFGACLGSINGNSGIVFGGIGADGTILEDSWTWTLHKRSDGSVYLELLDQTASFRTVSPGYDVLPRFGATITSTSRGLVLAGGIIPRRLVPSDSEILILDSEELLKCIDSGSPINTPIKSTIGLNPASGGQRPLLVGHAACAVSPTQVLFLGGGAQCFPSGAVWTKGTWMLSHVDDASATLENNWSLFRESVESTSESPAADKAKAKQPKKDRTRPETYQSTKEVTSIPRLKVNSPAEFQKILADARPVIIEDSDIGPCTDLWTKEYLVNAVGKDRKAIHEATSENMSFCTKNFVYTTKEFGTFMDEVYAGGRQYLRSISVDQPSKMPANLAADFPSLKDDFQLPETLGFVDENAHSSPLRISGPVTLWLHYDVMANVLCQIQGEKRLILYPPGDVQHLDVPAGASSSNINVFMNRSDGSIASIPGTSPHEALLKRGDILFLPPLWLHTAAPTGDVSVAVNVFFRNLSEGYAPGRDVYGNRDVQAYEKGRNDLVKIVKAFGGLPSDMARFYLLRLANELQEIAEGV